MLGPCIRVRVLVFVFQRIGLSFSVPASRLRFAAGSLFVAGLGFGGCAQSPQQLQVAHHGKEYFPSSVYGKASPKVIADGQPIPRGGGQYLVGKPYTIAGHTYYPTESKRTQVGYASWYGDAFHGRLTANGEIYDRDSFTAASPVLPLPSYVRVTNLRNNYSMVVRVNDRGPYASDRVMDVSRKVAEALDFRSHGTTKVKIDYIGRASLAGSDDAKLYATLRTSPGDNARPTMVARREEPAEIPVATREEEMPAAPPPRRARLAAYSEEPPPPPRVRPERLAEPRPARREMTEGRYTPEPEPRRVVRTARILDDDAEVIHRHTNTSARAEPLPPARPMDLGTIPGAASPIHARKDHIPVRLARSRDD